MTQMMETPFGTPVPPPGENPQPPRREPRRPGWTGVLAVGAAAALLSSLLTAGAVDAFGSDPSPVAAASAPAPALAGAAKSVAPGTGAAPNWVSVGSAVGPSVVSVQIEGAGGRGTGGEGSGVILDTAGRVLTNNHVVVGDGSGGEISVVLSDGRSYPAGIVGTDPSTDLAVIAMKSPPKGLAPATFGDSSAVKVGDPVMAIGNPLGLSRTVTTGIVSATDRPVSTSAATPLNVQDPFGGAQQSEQVVTNAIQTDAAINPGNSGGALVDSAGRVVGITSTIASLGAMGQSQAGSIGLGFAIPSNEAKDVASQLIADGSVQHAYLGVSLADDTVALDGAQRQAAVVGELTAGAPAAKAGLRVGDAIIEVDGASLDGADSLVGRIRAMRPDTKVTLTIVRDGKRLTLNPTVAARPTSGNG